MDCLAESGKDVARKMYDKICARGERLVSVGEEIEKYYGIPIIHKRIAVTPVSLLAGTASSEEMVLMARKLDEAAREVGVNFLGGYSALVHKGMSPQEQIFLRSIPRLWQSPNGSVLR